MRQKAEHRAYGKHSLGPRPHHDLAECRNRIDRMNEDKDNSKAKKAAYVMQSLKTDWSN